jgi:hypothetical protein
MTMTRPRISSGITLIITELTVMSYSMIAPVTTKVEVGITYTALQVERRQGDIGGGLFAFVLNTPELARVGVALAAEGDRWQIVLGGYFGDAAVPTRAGVMDFASSLPDRVIAQLLENRWVSDPAQFRFPHSRRQHWEKVRGLPAGLDEPPTPVTHQRRGGTVVGPERCQRLPPLGARHAEVHRVLGGRGQVHRLPVAQMHVQRAAGRAVPADARGHPVRDRGSRHLAEPEAARASCQLLGQRPVVPPQRRAYPVEAAHGTRRS